MKGLNLIMLLIIGSMLTACPNRNTTDEWYSIVRTTPCNDKASLC